MYKKSKKLKEIRDAVNKGAGICNACNVAGISTFALWTWRRKDKRVDSYVEKLLGHRAKLVEDALLKSALDGNVTAQIFFLKNRGEGWKDTPMVDQSKNYQIIWEIDANAGNNNSQITSEPSNCLEFKE